MVEQVKDFGDGPLRVDDESLEDDVAAGGGGWEAGPCRSSSKALTNRLDKFALKYGQISVVDQDDQTAMLSFHGWWSIETNAAILADLSALGEHVDSCVSLQLKDVNFESFEFGKAIISSLPNCQHLNLGMCLGSNLDAFVESSLLHLPRLQKLTFTGSAWSLQSFPPGCSLKEIHLENCRFESAEVVQGLAYGLESCNTLETVKIAHCRLRDNDLKVIIKCLPKSVHTLDLAGNYCRSEAAAALAGILLRDDCALKTVNLTNQRPGECGGSLDLSLLGLAIVSNTSLMNLDLSFNMLSNLDIQNLVAALVKNQTLRSINLMSNVLDDSSMQLIGKYLPRMCGLNRLNVMANRFGETGADALLQGLRTNVYLCDLAMPRGFVASETIDFYLALNYGGRRLLHPISSSPAIPCPLALWALVFDRVNRRYTNANENRAATIFHLLQGPVLFGKRT